MKPIKPFYAFSIAVCLASFIFSGCKQRNNDIPVNEANVTRHIIPIETARRYTAGFREGRAKLQGLLTDSSFLNNQFQLPIAVQFNRDVLALLLNQADSTGTIAQGVRMYFARNEKNEITLVLVPYDTKNNDIINKLSKQDVVSIPGISSASAFFAGGEAVDNALRCPSLCDNGLSGLGED